MVAGIGGTGGQRVVGEVRNSADVEGKLGQGWVRSNCLVGEVHAGNSATYWHHLVQRSDSCLDAVFVQVFGASLERAASGC